MLNRDGEGGRKNQHTTDLGGQSKQLLLKRKKKKTKFIDSNGLPRWLSGRESACQAGDTGLIPGLGRCSGEGNGNPPQYSCLENPMERGAWCAIVHGVTRVRYSLVTKPPPPI